MCDIGVFPSSWQREEERVGLSVILWQYLPLCHDFYLPHLPFLIIFLHVLSYFIAFWARGVMLSTICSTRAFQLCG